MAHTVKYVYVLMKLSNSAFLDGLEAVLKKSYTFSYS
jgi:hypothetical protein